MIAGAMRNGQTRNVLCRLNQTQLNLISALLKEIIFGLESPGFGHLSFSHLSWHHEGSNASEAKKKSELSAF